MSKLPKNYQFFDFSDYGRLPGSWIAKRLKNTFFTPIHVTTMFVIVGFFAVFFILNEYYISAAFLIILKSVLDAADGELSRLKQTPSYVGRYYDSIADIILNFFFLLSFWYVSEISILLMFSAFFCIQIQGTIYNFYYVILRNKVNGDSTSRIFEDSSPKALKGESQKMVDFFYKLYDLLYITFDKLIYYVDKKAIRVNLPFPNWFMTLISLYGLGFQLLIMAIMLIFNLHVYIIHFFIYYSALSFLIIGIRKFLLKSQK